MSNSTRKKPPLIMGGQKRCGKDIRCDMIGCVLIAAITVIITVVALLARWLAG